MGEDRASSIRKAYARALVRLRQEHDDEFQSMLADEYASMGLEVIKRKSRMASRRASSHTQEGQ